MNDLFVTGTDTNVGKTVLCALLCAALDRVYWKPVQTGIAEGPSDRETVIRLAGLAETETRPEVYRFDPPVSPHLAAQREGVRIELDRIRRPQSDKPLVIEGAGGALVPLNESSLMIDLMKRLGAPALIAARTSLGTINHTLLTLRVLRAAEIAIKGVVLIGEGNDDNRRAIERHGAVAIVGWIPPLKVIDPASLRDVFARYFDPAAFL